MAGSLTSCSGKEGLSPAQGQALSHLVLPVRGASRVSAAGPSPGRESHQARAGQAARVWADPPGGSCPGEPALAAQTLGLCPALSLQSGLYCQGMR